MKSNRAVFILVHVPAHTVFIEPGDRHMSITRILAVAGVATIALTGAALAQQTSGAKSAKDQMMKEESMKKDAMGKDSMSKDSMKKDAMKK
jgi:pentapeptide MXKDX repeat protein